MNARLKKKLRNELDGRQYELLEDDVERGYGGEFFETKVVNIDAIIDIVEEVMDGKAVGTRSSDG